MLTIKILLITCDILKPFISNGKVAAQIDQETYPSLYRWLFAALVKVPGPLILF